MDTRIKEHQKAFDNYFESLELGTGNFALRSEERERMKFFLKNAFHSGAKAGAYKCREMVAQCALAKSPTDEAIMKIERFFELY